MTFEHEHHAVSVAYAERLEIGGCSVGQLFHLAESEPPFLAVCVGPEEGFALRFLFSPCIDHVVTEIEIHGYAQFEVCGEILISPEFCLVKKSFNHKQLCVVCVPRVERMCAERAGTLC